MRRGKLDPGQVWYDIEEHLVPSLSLSPIERAIYCYLVRRSRLAHHRRLDIAVPTLARGTQISRSTAGLALRRLMARGLLRILHPVFRGLRIEVFLPREVPGCVVERIPDGRPLDSLDFYSSNLRRSAIYRREAGRCFYCLRRLTSGARVLDHVVPRTRGGTNSYRNVVACCLPCNMAKRHDSGAALLRKLFREDKLDAVELRARLSKLKELQRGRLKPVLKPSGPLYTRRARRRRAGVQSRARMAGT